MKKVYAFFFVSLLSLNTFADLECRGGVTLIKIKTDFYHQSAELIIGEEDGWGDEYTIIKGFECNEEDSDNDWGTTRGLFCSTDWEDNKFQISIDEMSGKATAKYDLTDKKLAPAKKLKCKEVD